MDVRAMRFFAAISVAIGISSGASISQAAAVPLAGAEFTNPVIGSTNVGMTKAFRWTKGSAAAAFALSIGTTPGGGEVSTAFLPSTQHALAIPPLPRGMTLWARIWSELPGRSWVHGADVAFTVLPARLMNPASAPEVVAMSPPFRWTASPAATAYYLGLGTQAGSADVFGAFLPASQTTDAVAGLPKGQTLWARIWTEIPGFGWYHGNDVPFTVAG